MRNILVEKTAAKDKSGQYRIYFYSWIFLAFIFTLVVLLSIRTEVNQNFFLALKYLIVPALSMSFYITLKFIPKYIDKTRLNWFMQLVVIIGLTAATVMGPGTAAVTLGNSILAHKQPQIFSGKITDKWISRGKSQGYNMRFFSKELSRDVWLIITEQEYANLKIGQEFSCQMTLGAFGILFNRS